MKIFLLPSLWLFFLFTYEARVAEDELREYLQNTYEKEITEICFKSANAAFDFATDIKNAVKQEKTKNVTLESTAWKSKSWNKYFKGTTPDDYKDPLIKRQVKFLYRIGYAALGQSKLVEYINVNNKIKQIYSTGKICPYKNQNCDLDKEALTLEPDIEDVMAKSRDYDELKYAWKAWRDNTGAKMKDLYKTYVDLSNEIAHLNDFSDMGAYWRDSYEDPDLVKHVDEIWSEVQPLYNELHKYVGRKLKRHYGDKLDISDGLIPAHILGNMWAQSWMEIVDILTPFSNVSKVDVDAAFKENNYTILDLFRRADEFYQSLGLNPMGICYNETAGAMIRKPTDGREVLCHASAWDFCDGHTFRLKMCTQLTFEDFITIHHEMGHIQYYSLYKHQPHSFRRGANPAFHEAIGDTMALSVISPQHLQKIGLVKDYQDSYKADINSLLYRSLEKVAFLPFGLIVDKWRWDVFNGTVDKSEWNSHWWNYRKKYQKVKPPVERSDETDFDPGAKYHVPGNSQYMAYFLARILQFQFFKSLCIAADEYDPENKTVPLHKCDFYNSKAAGEKLRSGLSLGMSKHWSETLKILTGSNKVSAEPLLEYFEPLYQFLKKENQNSGA